MPPIGWRVRPWRGSDPQSFHRRQVAVLDAQVRAQDEEPVHVLRERGQQLRALPIREGAQRRMGCPCHEIKLALAQRLHGFWHGEEKLQLGIVALALEEPQLHRGHRREI